jgi:RNA polymerase sigma factor (sigma-70 family)
MKTDFELLRGYFDRGSEDAFRELVERHLPMVRGVALRILNNSEMADDVAQAVFIILSRNGRTLSKETIIGGWLYKTARFVSLEALRKEQRSKRNRECLTDMNTESIWNQISPLLDEAVSHLSSTDRNAVVLRYLEEKSFQQVAGELGTSEAAAKMRVGRALEKLRSLLGKKGVLVPAALLATALENHASSPAGIAVSAKITQTIASATARPEATTLAEAGLKVLAWQKLRSGLVSVGVGAVLLGGAWLATHLRAHPIVKTFEPMAGVWGGELETRGDGIPKPIYQETKLIVRVAQGGRSCDIDMQVRDETGDWTNQYKFVHLLNSRGDRITTHDDPQVNRLRGEGIVTMAAYNGPTDWRAGFHGEHSANTGDTECQWERKGNTLRIERQDRTQMPWGKVKMISTLNLKFEGPVLANVQKQ